jgi:mRNA interferase MazF
MIEEIKELYELECGDIIKLNFSPTQGHEQDGYKPAMVLTNPKKQDKLLNGMVSVVPITNTKKGFPLHVDLDSRTKIQGTILMDQHRMVDLKNRGFQYIEKIPEDKLEKCKEIFVALYEKLLSI